MNSQARTVGLALGFALAFGASAGAADLKLMTGPQGGSWVPLGGQLKDMWEKAVPGTNVQSLPGAGIANVRGIEEDKTDIGFGNSISTVDAVAGKPPFNKPHDNVCNVATLYPQYFQVVVRADSGINSVKDLKGKSIAAQPRGNTAEEITKHILQVNGLELQRRQDELRLLHRRRGAGAGRSRPGFHARHHHSGRRGDGPRLGARHQAARSCGRSRRDEEDQSGLHAHNVPKGTYPKQDQDVKVIGYATHIVASCKLPEDTVYG